MVDLGQRLTALLQVVVARVDIGLHGERRVLCLRVSGVPSSSVTTYLSPDQGGGAPRHRARRTRAPGCGLGADPPPGTAGRVGAEVH